MKSHIKYSFYSPVEYNVLVKQIDVEEKSEGGIILPSETVEKEQWAETRAYLIAAGGNAFSDFKGNKPEVGDEIIVKKYAGFSVKDPETEEKFQVCVDKNISMIVKKNQVTVEGCRG